MRIVSWNVRHQELEKRIAEIVERLASSGADIIALQEVTIPLVDSVAGLLSNFGYGSAVDSLPRAATSSNEHKPFASMIVSKWPLAAATIDWRRDAPFPESFARATVTTPAGPADVISVHIPDGAAGWKKVATLHTLAAELEQSSEIPRIVAGDFNEPKDLLADGSIVTFSGIDPAETPKGHKLWTDHNGATGDLHEWERAVQSILGLKPTHDLQDAHRATYGGMFAPKTYFGPGRAARWFDHILVSRKFRVEKSGVFSEWLDAGVSDHAAVWAELA